EITVIDPDEPGTALKRTLQFFPGMDFHEHVKPERGRDLVQALQRWLVKRGDDEENRIRPGDGGLINLDFMQDEIFAQHREADGGTDLRKVTEVPVEKRFVR